MYFLKDAVTHRFKNGRCESKLILAYSFSREGVGNCYPVHFLCDSTSLEPRETSAGVAPYI